MFLTGPACLAVADLAALEAAARRLTPRLIEQRRTTYELGSGRRLENLPTLHERLGVTNTRYLEALAEVLASTVASGALASLARPVVVGTRRVAGLKLDDERVSRRLDVLRHPGPVVADWPTRAVHVRSPGRTIGPHQVIVGAS